MPTPTSLPADRTLERAAGVIRCLGHPLRLRLVDRLERADCSVSELVDAVGASQATVSHHLAILRGRGVVSARRDGPFVRYHLAEPRIGHILECVRNSDCPEADAAAGDSFGSEDLS
ncbi:MAG: metalloregulator ArsR/SmtB family transcription factor [Gemmatimonadales bacterium]